MTRTVPLPTLLWTLPLTRSDSRWPHTTLDHSRTVKRLGRVA